MTDIVDARDRFPGPDVPIAVPMDPHDVIDLARLRTLERGLQAPILNALHVIVAAEQLTRKAGDYRHAGYQHLPLHALDDLAHAVARLREARDR